MVGDFNVAMEHRDVHSCFKIDEIYVEQEIASMRKLFRSLMDTWRTLHPNESNVFTVWDERKNRRETNQVWLCK